MYIGPKVYELNKKINAKTFIELISAHYKSPALRKILSIFTVINCQDFGENALYCRCLSWRQPRTLVAFRLFTPLQS